MGEITRQDLTDAMNGVKDHIDLKIKPIADDVDEHKILLTGKDGRSGLVGDVNDMKNSGRIVKWLAGGGLGVAAAGWANKIFH